jgi:mannose-6-phosphate isomerase
MSLVDRDAVPPTDAARRMRAWMVEIALPLWAGAGYDRARGGFHERLGFDGAPDQGCPRRLMVQARQIYVYAHAAALGWYPPGKALALEALDALLSRYRSPDGAPGYVFSVSPAGSVADPLRDTYGHTFLLLAFGWLARTTGDAQVRALIDDVLAFFDRHLADGDGTYREGVPSRLPRRQNPHMHAFEAMLALQETIAHPQALGRAAGLRALLEARFLDPVTGRLGEYFGADWQPVSPPAPVEPGHHAEWSWLIARHAELSAQAPDPQARAQFEAALSHQDRLRGLLPDTLSADGQPATTFRCWPQTEFAKACITEHAAGRAGAAEQAAAMLERVRARYLSGMLPGGWTDQIDASGRPLAAFMPASTLYHLFTVTAEAERVLLRSPSGRIP